MKKIWNWLKEKFQEHAKSITSFILVISGIFTTAFIIFALFLIKNG